ncbi:MAG: hypothetical protein Q4E61_03020, partial [Alphaproteobacteria bacterium]|nr:hypothetical protein [Alphaproteobacteria bacterium]
GRNTKRNLINKVKKIRPGRFVAGVGLGAVGATLGVAAGIAAGDPSKSATWASGGFLAANKAGRALASTAGDLLGIEDAYKDVAETTKTKKQEEALKIKKAKENPAFQIKYDMLTPEEKEKLNAPAMKDVKDEDGNIIGQTDADMSVGDAFLATGEFTSVDDLQTALIFAESRGLDLTKESDRERYKQVNRVAAGQNYDVFEDLSADAQDQRLETWRRHAPGNENYIKEEERLIDEKKKAEDAVRAAKDDAERQAAQSARKAAMDNLSNHRNYQRKPLVQPLIDDINALAIAKDGVKKQKDKSSILKSIDDKMVL